MKLGDIEHDYDLFLKMVGINGSDRHCQLPVNWVNICQQIVNGISNNQLFFTKEIVYLWSMFYKYLLLFLKVFINTWLSRIMPNILPWHHRLGDVFR
jgi:hypothetical protein